MKLYLRDDYNVGENQNLENHGLFGDTAKSIWSSHIGVQSSELMSEALIEMIVKMMIDDGAFGDFHGQKFHSVGE
jgi:hypothetical protein